jgi:hypothetical protein
MNKRYVLVGIVMALVIAGLIITPALAKPTEIPIEAIECTVQIIEPGREWIDDEHVYHLRGRVVKNMKVADYALLNGTDTVLINLNLNLIDGSGDGFGSSVFQPDEVDGTFRGSWTGEFSGGLLTGRAVMHGTGNLQPMRGEASFEPIIDGTDLPCEGWEPMRFTGVIFDPLGRNLE